MAPTKTSKAIFTNKTTGVQTDRYGNPITPAVPKPVIPTVAPTATVSKSAVSPAMATPAPASPSLVKTNLTATIPRSQVPTANNPVVSIGEPEKKGSTTYYGRPFSELSNREKDIDNAFYMARQRSEFDNLDDDRLFRYIEAQFPAEMTAPDGTASADIIAERQADYDAQRGDLATRRKELVANQDKALTGQLNKDIGLVKGGQADRERASQSRFSFSGFGRSTENDKALGEIAQDADQQIQILNARKNAELAMFEAQQEDADEATLQGMRDNIDALRLEEDKLKIQNANKIAELNAANQVTAAEAIDNLAKTLGSEATSGFDKELTELISDGYLYSIENGIPTRIKDANGNDIATGVKGEGNLQYVPPLQNPLTGSPITPGYAFDKKTGTLYAVSSDGSSTPLPGGEQAMKNYQNFNEYVKNIGNGQIVEGSPYHQGFEVDIDGKIGDLVPSFVSGTVKKVSTNKDGYGNNVIVEDAYGNTYRYAHLNAYTVAEGQPIVAGQPLGTMGNTGNVIKQNGGDGSHLHIEARDKAGKLISLDSVVPETTWQAPQYGSGKNEEFLIAEAVMNGYGSKDEIQGYIAAKKAGYTPPNRAVAEKTQQNFDNTSTLITKYKPLNDEISTLNQGFAAIKDYNINHTNPSTDQALIFSFMKVLDPASVVREREYATAQNNASILDRVAANWKLAIDGEGILTVKQRQNIISEMKRLYKNKKTLYEDQVNQAKRVGEAFGVDPTLYINSNFQEVPATSAAPSGNPNNPYGLKIK